MDILSLDSLTVYVALGFVFIGVYTLARTFFYQEDERQAKQLLGEEDKNRQASNVVIKYSRIFFSRYIVPIVSGLKIDGYRKKMRSKLIAAGMVEEFSPDELFSFKLFLIVGAPAFLATFNWLAEFGLDWYYYPAMSVLGFFYPDLLISSAIRERQKQVRRSMPFIVDLLALSTEAGIDFIGAIGRVVEKAKPSPLVEELEQVLKEIQVGSSRADALRDMAKRLGMTEVSSFVAILVSADQMGASIGKVLRQQSEQIRNMRFLNAEREGAKVVQKMLIPLMLFILPAIMIMIFAPFAMQFWQGGGF